MPNHIWYLQSIIHTSIALLQPESLADVMKFDHGYNASSPPIQNVSQTVLYLVDSICTFPMTHAKQSGVTGSPYEKTFLCMLGAILLYSIWCLQLLEIMGEFTPDEQRSFLQFITGASRLPPGGLAALSPKLTIVRKVNLLSLGFQS
jgi:hypothetical protein